jgi:hypothetical protein
MQAAIAKSWAAKDSPLHGRMDFTFAPDGTPFLLDYEADSPFGLAEAGHVQWGWFEAWQAAEGKCSDSQENLIYESFIKHLPRIRPAHALRHRGGWRHAARWPSRRHRRALRRRVHRRDRRGRAPVAAHLRHRAGGLGSRCGALHQRPRRAARRDDQDLPLGVDGAGAERRLPALEPHAHLSRRLDAAARRQGDDDAAVAERRARRTFCPPSSTAPPPAPSWRNPAAAGMGNM